MAFIFAKYRKSIYRTGWYWEGPTPLRPGVSLPLPGALLARTRLVSAKADTVTATLIVSNNNKIQATQIQVQGMYAFIMSDEEAMENLSKHLQFLYLPSRVTRITLLEHALDIQLS